MEAKELMGQIDLFEELLLASSVITGLGGKGKEESRMTWRILLLLLVIVKILSQKWVHS